LNTICSKTTEHISPLADDVDCKVTEHNLTLIKPFMVITITSICVASNLRQDLDPNPAIHNLVKLVKILNNVVPDLG